MTQGAKFGVLPKKTLAPRLARTLGARERRDQKTSARRPGGFRTTDAFHHQVGDQVLDINRGLVPRRHDVILSGTAVIRSPFGLSDDLMREFCFIFC